MLVILLDNQIIAPQAVCQTCLMADQSGKPRWQSGKLYCGRAIRSAADRNATEPQPNQFECQMGFHIAEIQPLAEMP